jgi:hypothetical protein
MVFNAVGRSGYLARSRIEHALVGGLTVVGRTIDVDVRLAVQPNVSYVIRTSVPLSMDRDRPCESETTVRVTKFEGLLWNSSRLLSNFGKPWARSIFHCLYLSALSVGKLRSIADRGQLDARDERLKLAREKQLDLFEKLAVVTTESLELQHQLALHDKGFTEIATVQSSVRSTIAAIKRANDSSAVLRTTLSSDADDRA